MKSNPLRIFLLVLLVLAILTLTHYRDHLNIAALERWIHSAGWMAPLFFMLCYAVATVLFFPGSVLSLTGGALFGVVQGTIYNVVGATLGATLAFLCSRYLVSDWVRERTGERLQKLVEGVEEEGWRFVAFVRLVPIFPYNLLNYALGLTRIPLLHYSLATALFILPGGIAYTYVGYTGHEAMTGGEGIIRKVLLATTLLAVTAYLPRIIKRFRNRKTSNN